jgi:hypothetical protein
MSDEYYHYTSEVVIDEITTKNSIWLTNVFIKDKKSIMGNIELFIKSYYFQAISELKKEYPNSLSIQGLPNKYIDIMENGIIEDIIAIEFENSKCYENNLEIDESLIYPFDCACYILCMSKSRKNTYLKEYYSKGAKRLIEINVDTVKKDCISEIVKCVQNEEDKTSNKRNIRTVVGNQLRKSTHNSNYATLRKDYIEFGDMIYKKSDKIKRIRDYILWYEENAFNRPLSNYKKVVKMMFYELFILSLFFKEDGFEIEDEARLVLFCPIEYVEKLSPKKDCNVNISINISKNVINVLDYNIERKLI